MRVILLLLILCIGFLQYRIWFGEQSREEIIQLKLKIAEQTEQNELLRKQNEQLKQEIDALRNDPAMLEESAREQLGLIKQGETFYRIIPKMSD